MSVIRIQKLVRDTNGNITGGSDAIKAPKYVKSWGEFHSWQIERKRLRKGRLALPRRQKRHLSKHLKMMDDSGLSSSEKIGREQSLMCFRNE